MLRKDAGVLRVIIGCLFAALLVSAWARVTSGAELKVLDLSHQWKNGMPGWDEKFEGIKLKKCKCDLGRKRLELKFSEHTGTHMDAPAHRMEGGYSMLDIPARRFFGKCLIMDMRPYVRDRARYAISAEDLKAWQLAHGVDIAKSFRDGFVFIYTGWSQYWDKDPEKYMKPNFPGLGREAAQYLARCQVSAVGLDVPSIDNGPSKEFPAHVALYERNIFGIENLANLDKLADRAVFAVLAPMKIAGEDRRLCHAFIRGGSGAPTRVLAFYNPADDTIQKQIQTAAGIEAEFASAKLFDLTNTVQNGMPHRDGSFDGIKRGGRYEDAGFYFQILRLRGCTGTFVRRSPSNPQLLHGRAVVVDASQLIADRRRPILTREDIENWERSHKELGGIQRGDIVVLYMGFADEWTRHCHGVDTESYNERHGGISLDAAQLLADRGVAGVLFDLPGPDIAEDVGGGLFKHGRRVGDTERFFAERGIWWAVNLGGDIALAANRRGYIFCMICAPVEGYPSGNARVWFFEGLDLSK